MSPAEAILSEIRVAGRREFVSLGAPPIGAIMVHLLRRLLVTTVALGSLLIGSRPVCSAAGSSSELPGVDVEVATEGQPLTLTAEVGGGEAPFTFQWYKDGALVPGANLPRFSLTAVQVTDAGLYAVVVANAAGSLASAPLLVQVSSAAPSRLANVAIVAGVGDPVYVGFTLAGGGAGETSRLLARAAGPALGTLGVTGTLPDPVLELNAAGSVVATNDNWGGGDLLTAVAASVGAFAFPADGRDAALVADLAAGGYTVRVADAGGQAGTTAVELYEVRPEGASPSGRLTNLSARAAAGPGSAPFTLGFTITGRDPLRLLVRGVGPELARFGVTTPLADPRLHLFRRADLLATNENWGDTRANEIAAGAAAVGAFALAAGSRDAALLVALEPGTYSVQLTGSTETTGLALIELYVLP